MHHRHGDPIRDDSVCALTDCGCAERARRLFQRAGYHWEDGYWIKGDVRVQDSALKDRHFVESVKMLFREVT